MKITQLVAKRPFQDEAQHKQFEVMTSGHVANVTVPGALLKVGVVLGEASGEQRRPNTKILVICVQWKMQ